MAAGLTLAQMEFLLEKGLSLGDAVELAKLGGKKSAGAERQARYRARKQGRDVTSDVTRDASLPPIEDHTPLVSSNDETSVGRKSKVRKPEDVTPQTWTDFTALRARQKAPVSETAITGIRREAERAGWTMDAALSEAVSRGWRGFKAAWVAEERGTGPPGNVSYLDNLHAKLARTPA